MPFTISHLNSFSESLRMHEAIVFHNRSRSNQVPDLNLRVLFCLMLKNCIMQRHSQKMKLWFRISAVHNPCIIMHSSCTIHAQYMPKHANTCTIHAPTTNVYYKNHLTIKHSKSTHQPSLKNLKVNSKNPLNLQTPSIKQSSRRCKTTCR